MSSITNINQQVASNTIAMKLETIVRDVRAHITQIKHFTYGRHIITRLEKATGGKIG